MTLNPSLEPRQDPAPWQAQKKRANLRVQRDVPVSDVLLPWHRAGAPLTPIFSGHQVR